VQSLLKVVEDFVTGLREEDALQPTVGGSSAAFAEGRERANRAAVVTPANQKIFKPALGSKQQQQAEERKRKDGEGEGEKEGERQTQDSSINTAPVLRPPPLDHAALKEKEQAATEGVGQRGEGQEKQSQPEQKPKGPPRLVVKDSAKNNVNNNSKSVVVDPSSTRKEITDARHRLAQASNRRKSLEPPIGREEADRMAGLHRNLEGRKRPPGIATGATGAAGATHLGKPTTGRDNNDGIRGARQYLGSDDNQTESAGASIGSAAGNNVATQIGRSKPNVGGKRKKKSHTDDVFDFSTLPAHLQKSLAEIKQRKLDASAAKKKKPIDLTGLQRLKDRDGYDPRRLMH